MTTDRTPAERVGERIHKVLARAGVCSLRAAERLVATGRVAVNGTVVERPGQLVDPEHDTIKVDGKRLPALPARPTYLMLNKPRGCVSTLRDPEGRPTVADLLPRPARRVFPVGRLDFHSEGLILFTDDGDLAHALMHPRFGVPKTYRARVRGRPDEAALARLARGLVLDGKRTHPAQARRTREPEGRAGSCWIEVTVREGRKHQVRRMLQAIGHPVARLRRVAYGGVQLGRLPPRAWRHLTASEVERLRRAVTERADAGRKESRRSP